MACYITDKRVRDDVNGKLETIIVEVSDGLPSKENILIAGINNDLRSFLDFANKELASREISVVLTSVPQLIEELEKPKNGFTKNVLKNLFNSYYNQTHPGCNTPVTVRAISTDFFGFSSLDARRIASDYCATILAKIDWINSHRARDKRIKLGDKIKLMINEVKEEYIIHFEYFASQLLAKDSISDKLKRNRAKIQTIILQYSDYKDVITERSELKREYKNSTDETRRKEIRELLKDEKYITAEAYMFAAMAKLINEYGDTIEKNQFNLFNELSKYNENENNTRFLDFIFSNSRCLDLKEEYDGMLESTKMNIIDNPISEEDIEDFNSDNVDMMARSWENSDYKDFAEFLDHDIRAYFNTLFKMSSPYEDSNDDNGSENIKRLYDRNNSVALPQAYNYKYVFEQIHKFANFNSLEDFINSIKQISKVIPELYGFSKLAYDMEADKNFARHIFVMCDQEFYDKVMTVVNGDGTINNEISNVNSNSRNKLFWDTVNFIRTAYLGIRDGVLNKQLLDTYKELKANKVKGITQFKNQFVFGDTIDLIYKAVQKLNPDINRNIIYNYITQNENHIENTLELLNIINGIFNELDRVIKSKEDNKSLLDVAANSSIISNISYLINLIERFNANGYDLNSRNAERNLSSDLIKHSYISRIFRMLTPENIQQFLNKYKDSAQYKYSILFTGIHEDGVNVNGIFDVVDGELVVNEKNLEDFKKYYFNGIRDEDNYKGVMYSEMSKSDYFFTQLMYYFNPIVESGESKSTINERVVNAFVQTPSDAPKNFLFRLPKYKFNNLIKFDDKEINDFIDNYVQQRTEELQNTYKNNKKRLNEKLEELTVYAGSEAGRTMLLNRAINEGAIKNFTINRKSPMFIALRKTLLGELNLFIDQLNLLFPERTGYTLNKDDKGLLELVHYKLDDNNKPVFVKNGRLVGNFFHFDRLFAIENDGRVFNADSLMQEMFSLYGGLIIDDGNGNLRINLDYLFDPNYENSESFVYLDNGKLKLVIIEEVKNNLNNIVEEFVSNYFESIITNTIEYNSINDGRFSTMQIVEFCFGNILSNYAFADLFLGDAKFYKNAQTFLKRAKEIQAGGISYAGFDYGKQLNNNVDNPEGEIVKVGDREIKVANKPMKLDRSFRAVTIWNTIKPSDVANNIKKEVEQIIINKGLDANYARAIAENIAKGFGYNNNDYGIDGEDTTVNDAQSYITFEEFIRRRVLDGTIDNYKELIEQIYAIREGKKTLSDLTLEGFNARIQIQKNFYYDTQVDTTTGINVPRQIKNAEFVLIPELLQNTDLAKVYELMDKYNIHQLNTAETSKAAHRDIITLWDEQGVAHFDEFEKAIAEGSVVENYSYMYLYKQQDVVSHLIDKENKMGIQLAKKMMDNSNDELRPIIEKYIKNYVANIKQSFVQLLNDMGWAIDDNGNFINKTGDKNAKLDFTKFYEKARYEANRLGKDANFLEYLTPDPITGEPLMPNWMNMVSDKIMSIAQAIFNSGITRQTLPGWHAAQVTRIGADGLVLDRDGKPHKLQYHPEVKDKEGNVIQEAYTEILIAPWSDKLANMSIEELEEAGLDKIIIYRMPTEGKQSTSVAKIVGWLSPVYDSTVMVADEWVTQTGSDFDVDTIYAIIYEMTRDAITHRVKKITSVDFDNASTAEKQDGYVDYILDCIDLKLKKHYYDSVKDEREILRNSDIIKNQFGERENPVTYVNEIQEIIKNLPDNVKQGISNLYREAIANNKKDNGKIDLNGLAKSFNAMLRRRVTVSDDFKVEYDNLVNTVNKLLAYYDKQSHIGYVINKAARFDQAQKYAKEYGYTSYEEWLQLPNEEKQTNAARNNDILDAFIQILENSNSREENYARSNFDDLSAAKKQLDGLRGETSRNRSAYNSLDQIDFMEQARSGATIKAFSVTRDTFDSICNYIKAELDIKHHIKVRYSENVKDAKGNKVYNRELIKAAYDINENGEVVHYQLAHSKNNRNVVGKLITTYGSQTTAHILDAMKTGSIYNENKFTFGTFKTLIDLGVDYLTAEAFLMQPAITEICKAYYEGESIYIKSGYNPIYTAIRRIIDKLNVKQENDESIITTINRILTNNKDVIIDMFKLKNLDIEIFDKMKDKIDFRFVIDAELLMNRISRETNGTSTNNDLLFDLCIALEFDKIYNTTKNIESLTRVSNPDKFGAKQTIHATQTVLNNISNYRDNSEDERGKEIGSTILVKKNGKYINYVDAIYPLTEGNSYFSEYEQISIENSSYPYLAAFMMYTTQASVKINKQLFDLDRLLSDKTIDDKMKQLIGLSMNDETYNKLKKYYVNYLFNMQQTLILPMTVSLDDVQVGQVICDEERAKAYESEEDNAKDGQNREIMRIMGRDTFTADNFVLTGNLEEDIKKFNELSPVQKVIWIKQHYQGNARIFDFLTPNIYTTKNGSKVCSITYNEQSENIEILQNEFSNAYYQTGKSFEQLCFRLACIDLVKYAFIAEGFNFRQGAICKIINNNIIYDDISENGMCLIDSFGGDIKGIKDIFGTRIDRTFFDRFIRANKEITREINCYSRKTKQIGARLKGGALYVSDRNITDLTFIREQLKLSSKDSLPAYIRIKSYDPTIKKFVSKLYKTKSIDDAYVFIPIPTLDKQETSSVSANIENNRGYYGIGYETLIETVIRENSETEVIKKIIQDFDISKVAIKSYKTDKTKGNTALQILANSSNAYESGPANVIIGKITEAFEDAELSSPDTVYISYLAEKFADKILGEQKIVINGEKVKVKITKETKDNNRLYYENIFDNKVLGKEDKNYDVQAKKNPALKRGIDEYVKEGGRTAVILKVEKINNTEVENRMFSTTSDIETFDEINNTATVNPTENIELVNIQDNVISTVSILGKEVYKAALNNDPFAESFKRYIDSRRININIPSSLRANSENLYMSIAAAYKLKSEDILNKLHNLTIPIINEDGEITTTTFDVSNIEDYKKLLDNEQAYAMVVSLLLEARTFGRQVRSALNITKSENPIINKALEDIINDINNVRNSQAVRDGFKYIFDEYFGKYYTGDPLTKRRISDLRTTFGETDFLDLWISDTADLNNKQVQVITKLVNGILTDAHINITKKVKDKFNKDYDEIIKVGVNWKNIVDSDGKLIQDYNNEFLEDKAKMKDNYLLARREMNDKFAALENVDINDVNAYNAAYEDYKTAAENFYKKELEFKWWMLTNTEQAVIRNYYIEDYNNERDALDKAKDVFIEYRMLREMLYKYSDKIGTLSPEDVTRVNRIKRRMYDLQDVFNDDMTEKSHAEVQKIKALKKYIKTIKELDNKYFEYKKIEGWEETKDRYLQYIEQYDRRHPDETIDVKLHNLMYKEAFDWLSINTVVAMNEAVWGKLQQYESILSDENSPKNNISKMIDIASTAAKAKDNRGIIDGRKFSDEQLAAIKRAMEAKYRIAYDSETRLIKDVDDVPSLTKEFYNDLYGTENNTVAIRNEKGDIIAKINKLIVKGIPANSSHIDTLELFKNLTEDELNELVELYDKLSKVHGPKKSKDFYRRLKELADFKTNDIQYNIERQKAINNLTREQQDIWFKIFAEIDDDGNYIPNRYIYGYMTASKPEYIDSKKTEARQILKDNIEYVTNEYYEAAEKEAFINGNYAEWFEKNHVFNPYTRKWEPLRIWTQRRIKETSEFLKDDAGNPLTQFVYEPSFNNKNKYIREEFRNKPDGIDFDYSKPNFNRNTAEDKYKVSITRTENEQRMYNLLYNTMMTYAKSRSARKFVNEGFLPRDAKYPIDGRWVANQILGAVGLDIPADSNQTWNDINYNDDEVLEADMFKFIRAKGYTPLEIVKNKELYTPEAYERIKAEIAERNKQIKANNLKLEAAIRNEDWKQVFNTLIEKGEDAAARERIKDTMYLLLEDLTASKEEGGNLAYRMNSITGRLIRDKESSNEEQIAYKTQVQDNTIKLWQNYIHRLIYREYKEPNKLTKVARIAQNATSAKYMMMNLTGGVANVYTGTANILGEAFAGQYFDMQDYMQAIMIYSKNAPEFIRDFFNPDAKSSTKEAAMIKKFRMVDYDSIMERNEGESLNAYMERVRGFLYSFQSMGEHAMQNVAMIAASNSHRIFQDINGRWIIGTFGNYTWNLEQIAMFNILDQLDAQNDNHEGSSLRETYEQYVYSIKKDLNNLVKFTKFRRDFNAEFIRATFGNNLEQIAKLYNAERKKLTKKAKNDFYEKTSLRDALIFEDGDVFVDESKHLTGLMLGQFIETCRSINNKIHGVYNKNGAAKLETKLLGSLVMQYHKHIYPGIMKRWRINGYYNETRGTIEKGSYISFIDFLGTEFNDLSKKIKETSKNNDEYMALSSIREVFKAFIRTFTNAQVNWELLPEWEKENMRRQLGDLCGLIGSMCWSLGIYLAHDDDEIKDSETLSTMLYIADRCFAESNMYYPWGLYSEWKTLYSSPVAASNGPIDMIKVMQVYYNVLTDEDYDPYYTTGQYRGKHKAAVALYRNIPVYRVYNRLSNMTKNNSYYRLGETSWSKLPKSAAEAIKGNK